MSVLSLAVGGGGGEEVVRGDFVTETWIFVNSKIQFSTGKRKKEKKNTKKKEKIQKNA